MARGRSGPTIGATISSSGLAAPAGARLSHVFDQRLYRSFGITMAALALLTLSGAALELDASNFDKEVSRRRAYFVSRHRRNSALQ